MYTHYVLSIFNKICGNKHLFGIIFSLEEIPVVEVNT